jgi:hypothetical protein
VVLVGGGKHGGVPDQATIVACPMERSLQQHYFLHLKYMCLMKKL